MHLIRAINHDLNKACELLAVQANLGGDYNSNGAKLILAEVQTEHGRRPLMPLLKEFNLESIFGFKPGTVFKR